jgi:hypothetical protein
MDEPTRIGLTREANDFLDEILEDLNSQTDEKDLLKRDLYRLAVALGVKQGNIAKPLLDHSDNSFRASDIDPDRAFYYAVESKDLDKKEVPIYKIVERLADQGVRNFYEVYKSNMGRIPWDELLK